MIRNNRFSRIIVLVLLFSSLQHYSYAQDRGEQLYSETFQLYKSLAVNPDKARNKEIWEIIARAFNSIYQNYPSSSKAPNSLFLSGKMYEEIGERFNSKKDLNTSLDLSRLFVRKFPDSNLADDAQLRVARIVEKSDKSKAYLEYQKVVDDFPNGDMKVAANNKMQELSPFKPSKTLRSSKPKEDTSHLVKVKEIRHWSTEDFTRVVIHLDKKMPFKSQFLRADPKKGIPPRLYVDIGGTVVDKNLYIEPITKGLLEQIKFARNTKDRVRVVLYIKSYDNYKVFALEDPFRIVMDIHGTPPRGYAKKGGRQTPKYGTGSIDEDIGSLSEVFGLKINTVVIDAGHGGHDPGAIGNSGTKEKDITLKIAKALKKKLDKDGKKLGITKVHLTRSTDIFIPLEERTGIAKREGADLFISIHCNAARSQQAHGIETYYLSLTNNKNSLAVAARENATNTISRSEMESVLKDYLLSAKIEESEQFAKDVQKSVVRNVSKKYQPIQDRGVEKAPFVVLIGADIPSILVETSFITNPREEKRLRTNDYINRIADGIYAGIEKFATNNQTASIQYKVEL